MAPAQHMYPMPNHVGAAAIGLLACLAWTSPALTDDLIPHLKGTWCDVSDEKSLPSDVVRIGMSRPNEITLSPVVTCDIDEIFEQQGDNHYVVRTSCWLIATKGRSNGQTQR